jgi:hypothetical protein
MFSASIRNKIESLCFALEDALKNEIDVKEDYLSTFSIANEDRELLELLNQFGAENSELVGRNLAFVNPSQFRSGDMLIASISMQTPLGEFADYFNDFINATSRVFLSFEYKYQKKQYFRSSWERLNSDFFSDEIEIKFRAILFQFWYTGGGGMVEDLIPEDDLTIRWQGHDPEGEFIVRQLEDAIHNERGRLEVYDDELLRRPYNILEFRTKVSKSASLEFAFETARQMFEKVTYLIRLQSRGGAHYSCIIGDYYGNKMNSTSVTIYEPLNQQFIPLGISQIGWPDIRAFHNTWSNLKLKKIDDFMFQNQKFRDYAQTKNLGTSSSYGKHYKLTIRLEQILDFVQIIESTIGEFGTSNAEYLDKLHDKNLQAKIETLINLRHKYVHGSSDELNAILNEHYGNQFERFDLLDQDIESLAYITRLTVMKAIINPDIKDKLLEYHLEKGRKAYGHEERPRNRRARFPEFTSIWQDQRTTS